jgi:hypothetical protein
MTKKAGNVNKAETQALNIPVVSGSLEDIYLFKVSDYTTILLGRYDKEKDCFYVQRGDGVKYEYDEYRIVWRQKLNCH